MLTFGSQLLYILIDPDSNTTKFLPNTLIQHNLKKITFFFLNNESSPGKLAANDIGRTVYDMTL